MSDQFESRSLLSQLNHPPRRGQVVALGVDDTARKYSLTGFSLAGLDDTHSHRVFVALQACGGDVYYYFSSSSTVDMDDSASVAAGGTFAYHNSHCAMIPNGVTHEVCLDRTQDLYLVVMTSTSTATLRMWAASDAQ